MNALYQFFNQASRLVLDLDLDTKNRLAELENKTICIEFTVPILRFFLIPGKDGIAVIDQYDGEVEMTLTGPLSDFIRLGTQGVKSKFFSEGQITIQGNAEVGHAFQKILSGIDLDWEELLSRVIGDTPARKLGNVIRGLEWWVTQILELSRENLGDYLKEEKQLLATPLAVERLENSVDNFRADVDRLEQRIDKLWKSVFKSKQWKAV